MGSKSNRKSNPAKVRSSTSKQCFKQAAKKHLRWSRDRSERVRDDLNRDADILYNALENPFKVPSSIPLTNSVASLEEGMQGLGT